MILSTMPDHQLTLRHVFDHGHRVHSTSRVFTFTGDGFEEATFAEIGDRAAQLAGALHRLGVGPGTRVGTFCWNNQGHLEAYLAVPSMGAVLHTLNIRLFPEQLAYVINHAEDDVIIVDASLVPLLARVRDQLTTVRHIIVRGAGDTAALGETLDYDALLAAEEPRFAWPHIDERQGAAMCYTSGTTGNPKGVMYSHRSAYLHTLVSTSAQTLAISERDRLLVIVPMFHANAWGMPYAGWWVGADIVLPQQHLQGPSLARIIEATRPTISGAVPTILNDLLHNAPGADLSSLRMIVCGGSAVPRGLFEGFDATFGVPIVQAWGMTETSPLAAVGWAPKDLGGADEMSWRVKAGRVSPGIDLRITDDAGAELPWDGLAVGEIEVRGPWVTASYYAVDDPEKFHDGWLRTGDVGSVSPNGFITISDRAKDVIKSGGEWVSSVDLENAIMGHPEVLEAAVVGIPDPRWDERPLACVVRVPGSTLGAPELRTWLAERVVKWWLPDSWTFVDEVPKTSVGKFDKKVLRARHAAEELTVELLS